MKRTTRDHILKLLKENPDWKTVDLGCGATAACEHADVLVDVKDWSENYPNKEFVVYDVESKRLPFEDDEFDFCFASHILEHVTDPATFLSEINRISKMGYIEVPTPLADNLVSGDDWSDRGHKWWIFYDDVENEIVIRPRRLLLHKTVDIPELNMLYPFFRDGLVLQLHWENKIDAHIEEEKYYYEDNTYDLSKQKIDPWILGSSVLMRGQK